MIQYPTLFLQPSSRDLRCTRCRFLRVRFRHVEPRRTRGRETTHQPSSCPGRPPVTQASSTTCLLVRSSLRAWPDRLPRSDKSEWPRLGRGRVLATSAEASRQDRPGAPVTTHLSHSLKPTWRFRLQRFCCLISRRASRLSYLGINTAVYDAKLVSFPLLRSSQAETGWPNKTIISAPPRKCLFLRYP